MHSSILTMIWLQIKLLIKLNGWYTVVATLLLTNDTHISDTRTITHWTRTITHDTQTITNLLNFHDTRTKTIKHATERFYTIKHAKSKLTLKIKIKGTYCFNLYCFVFVFNWKATCTLVMHSVCFIFYE